MEIINLKTNPLNQNNYNKNILTPENIGSLLIYPIGYTPETCLSCDGYILKIIDYELLYSVIGKKFNSGIEQSDEFRIPDYNITKRFLQPGTNVGDLIEAGLPDHLHTTTMSGRFGNAYTGYAGCCTANGGGGSGTFASNNASVSNSIYGSSNTVQPPSQIVHVCIRYK